MLNQLVDEQKINQISIVSVTCEAELHCKLKFWRNVTTSGGWNQGKWDEMG